MSLPGDGGVEKYRAVSRLRSCWWCWPRWPFWRRCCCRRWPAHSPAAKFINASTTCVNWHWFGRCMPAKTTNICPYNTDPQLTSMVFFTTPAPLGYRHSGLEHRPTKHQHGLSDQRPLFFAGGYLGRNYEVFACPAAAYFVRPPQQALGWDHRARSVAMNAAVGDGLKYDNPNPFGWTLQSWYSPAND